MTPLQTLRLQLGLPVDPSAEEIAVEEARYRRLRAATPIEQLALRMNRLRAAGWDAEAHGNDPRRLAGGVHETSGFSAAVPPGHLPAESLAMPVRCDRGAEVSP